MKRIKKIAVVLLVGVSLLLMTACAAKEALAVTAFNEIMGEAGYSIKDVTETINVDYVETISLAVKEDYQLEFYVFDDKDSAVSVFEQSRSVFEANAGDVSATLAKNIGNYNFYSSNSDGIYRMVARIDNTMLYVVADAAYKEEITKMVKELGY